MAIASKKYFRLTAAMLAALEILASCRAEGGAAVSESGVSDKPPITQEILAFAETGEPERLFPDNIIVTSAEALNVTGALVEPDTAFKLRTTDDFDENELCSLLSMQPETELRLTRDGFCEYTLTCGELPKGGVVKLLLGDGSGNTVYSWAFQTKGDFCVTSTLPGDKSVYSAFDTGVEVCFTSPADPDRAAEYFEITPPVSGKFINYSSTLAFVPDEKLLPKTLYTVVLKKGLPAVSGETLERDYTFSFRTAAGNSSTNCYALDGISETYLPGDPIVIDVFSTKEFISPEPVEFDFTLYGYGSAEDYRAALLDSIDGGAD